MTKFDEDRLRELKKKSENEGLTEDEIREVEEMMEDFITTIQPMIANLASIYSETIRGVAETLRPVAELLDDEMILIEPTECSECGVEVYKDPEESAPITCEDHD